MVGVINPKANQPLDTYRDGAKKASFVLQPGDSWPSEAESNTKLPNPPAFPSSTSPAEITVTASPTPTTMPTSSSSSTLSAGGIAGVALGAAAVVTLIGGLFFFLGRRKSQPPSAPLVAAAYEKQGPVNYIAPLSPPPSAFTEHMAYRGYAPDPRAFPPHTLVDDKPPGWRETRSSRPVEMVGSPSGEYIDSHGHSRTGSQVGDVDNRWDGRSPVSTVRDYHGRDPREGMQ
jgi:hypothetical protein